jgi:3-oxoacyl-[acyl-carrier protein] reductase
MSETNAPLKGKVAVVAGGTGGIGAASAHALAQAGACVVVGYNSNHDGARRLLADLPGEGHGLCRLSMEEPASIAAMAGALAEQHGRIHILINAAGATKPVPHADLDALSDELWDSIFLTNVRGPFSVIRALAPLLRQSGEGVVVNVSSISGFTGSGSNIAYCAAKGALDTMTLSLARALGPSVRVLSVSPGAVATDFVAGRDRVALGQIAAKTPLRHIVEPEDVAEAVMACITHLRASTGIRIAVDSGRFLV